MEKLKPFKDKLVTKMYTKLMHLIIKGLKWYI